MRFCNFSLTRTEVDTVFGLNVVPNGIYVILLDVDRPVKTAVKADGNAATQELAAAFSMDMLDQFRL